MICDNKGLHLGHRAYDAEYGFADDLGHGSFRRGHFGEAQSRTARCCSMPLTKRTRTGFHLRSQFRERVVEVPIGQ